MHGHEVANRETTAVTDQVINSLESTCHSFEDMQSELQALIKHAEELTSWALSSERQGRETGLPAPAEPLEPPEPAVRVRFEDPLDPLKPLDDDGELEKKFSKLLKTLRERMSEEEELQRRCKAAIQSMDMLCLDGRGRYFYC